MNLEFDFNELIEFGKRFADKKRLNNHLKEATREMAKMLNTLLINNTPIKTGELVKGWTKYLGNYKVMDRGSYFEVVLINRTPYAKYVNDGHYSYNQFNKGGDPYEVKNRSVTYTQGNKDVTFVYGHFFVEKSIIQLEGGNYVEKIIERHLEDWFRWCLSGK